MKMIHSRLIPRRLTGAGKIIRIVIVRTPTLFVLALMIHITPVYAHTTAHDNWEARTQGLCHAPTSDPFYVVRDDAPRVGEVARHLNREGYRDLREAIFDVHNDVRPVGLAPCVALTMGREGMALCRHRRDRSAYVDYHPLFIEEKHVTI